MCCSKLRLWSETCFSRTLQVVMEPYLTYLGMLCKFSFTLRWTNGKCILFGGFAFQDNQDINFSRLPSFFIGSHARFGETIRSRSFTVWLKPGFQIKCEDYLSERNHISRKLPPEIFNCCEVECVEFLRSLRLSRCVISKLCTNWPQKWKELVKLSSLLDS